MHDIAAGAAAADTSDGKTDEQAGLRPASDAVGRVLDGVDRLSEWGAWASALCILGILTLIVAEVVARNIFNKSIDFAWEFSAFLMGAAFMLGAAYSLRTGSQVRVKVLLDNLPPPGQRALDLFATALCVIVAAYLTFALGAFDLALLDARIALRQGERTSALDRPVSVGAGRLAVHAAIDGALCARAAG